MNLQEILKKAAESDLRAVRKHGVLAVCQTKLGTIELTFDRVAKTYGATTCKGLEVAKFQDMKKAQAIELLISSYKVEFTP